MLKFRTDDRNPVRIMVPTELIIPETKSTSRFWMSSNCNFSQKGNRSPHFPWDGLYFEGWTGFDLTQPKTFRHSFFFSSKEWIIMQITMPFVLYGLNSIPFLYLHILLWYFTKVIYSFFVCVLGHFWRASMRNLSNNNSQLM